jgi:hypothetical protein
VSVAHEDVEVTPALQKMFDDLDADSNGSIDIQEFALGTTSACVRGNFSLFGLVCGA